MLLFNYVSKLKFELNKSIYQDILGGMKQITDETMSFMIITDIENHFVEIDVLTIISGVVIAVMLLYLYFESR